MGLFGFGKKENVVDLAERYRQKKERENSSAEESSSEKDGYEETDGSSGSETSESAEERKKKLAKRIIDIVTRLDDLSNKIYHLQQRVELLERKANIS